MDNIWKLLRNAGLSENAIGAIEAAINKHCEKAVSEAVVSIRKDLRESIKAEIVSDVNKICRDLIDVHETYCLSKHCSVPKADPPKTIAPSPSTPSQNKPESPNIKLCKLCGKPLSKQHTGLVCAPCLKLRDSESAWGVSNEILKTTLKGQRMHIGDVTEKTGLSTTHVWYALNGGVLSGEIVRSHEKAGHNGQTRVMYALATARCTQCNNQTTCGKSLCDDCMKKAARINELKAELDALEAKR